MPSKQRGRQTKLFRGSGPAQRGGLSWGDVWDGIKAGAKGLAKGAIGAFVPGGNIINSGLSAVGFGKKRKRKGVCRPCPGMKLMPIRR